MRDAIAAAEAVIPCRSLALSQPFYEALGWRVTCIFPADAPRVVSLVGHGVRLRLDASAAADAALPPPLTLRLLCDTAALSRLAAAPRELVAPEGTRLLLVPADAPVLVPPPSADSGALEVTHAPAAGTGAGAGADAAGAWKAGRAGLLYRDLIPSRRGGRFIASHILIRDGGAVADYVHFHRVVAQLIYVRAGWVRVAYEGMAAFTMRAGDAVLQPPTIRHRVLEASAGLEVVEVVCPAEHETHADPDTVLDTEGELGAGVLGIAADAAATAAACAPPREWEGQRFVRHVAAGAPWAPWCRHGSSSGDEDGSSAAASFVARDTGIGAATQGLVGARVVRVAAAAAGSAAPALHFPAHAGDFLMLFVDAGSAELTCGSVVSALRAGDCAVIPRDAPHSLAACSADLQLLEVTLPATLPLAAA